MCKTSRQRLGCSEIHHEYPPLQWCSDDTAAFAVVLCLFTVVAVRHVFLKSLRKRHGGRSGEGDACGERRDEDAFRGGWKAGIWVGGPCVCELCVCERCACELCVCELCVCELYVCELYVCELCANCSRACGDKSAAGKSATLRRLAWMSNIPRQSPHPPTTHTHTHLCTRDRRARHTPSETPAGPARSTCPAARGGCPC